ncbi:uncharacterized protein J8A68_003092 [[Candida] subhashii]|uniref:Uncharacterized protein n=1 Tax=[Candida] subhashii TaxID=561895 RepID=A0A8J5QAS1_9ASCO|nr:uncharacterized protein J8A68_003092 [[Candida] subhashii]KAG7663344.1 hypothetical protein J8A68_003092 [[Candida] subhashii]
MVTNSKCEDTLNYFFEQTKDYLKNGKGFVVDSEIQIMKAIKKNLPNKKFRFCPISINQVLCQAWIRNGNIAVLSQVSFLYHFFNLVSISNKREFNQEWQRLMMHFDREPIWKRYLGGWYQSKEHWQHSYSQLPMEDNQFVNSYHLNLRDSYIGNFEWKHFTNLLQALGDSMYYIQSISMKVKANESPRLLSSIEDILLQELRKLNQLQTILLSESNGSNVILLKTDSYTFEHILRHIINNEHVDEDDLMLEPGTDSYFFPYEYNPDIMKVEAAPEELPILPLQTDIQEEDPASGFTQIIRGDFEEK